MNRNLNRKKENICIYRELVQLLMGNGLTTIEFLFTIRMKKNMQVL